MARFMAELYRPKPSWMALTAVARRNFLQELVAQLGPALENGASLIACGAADPVEPMAADYRFFALWQLRDHAAAKEMLRITLASGWYQYFETITTAGESAGLDDHLTQLIEI